MLKGLGGIRVFALSPDRTTLAAATESAVYVASVSDWLANRAPEPALSTQPSQVVWDLALNADGSALAMLSGTEDAGGTVGAIHEIGLIHQGSDWVQSFNSAVPFSRAMGQVWTD